MVPLSNKKKKPTINKCIRTVVEGVIVPALLFGLFLVTFSSFSFTFYIVFFFFFLINLFIPSIQHTHSLLITQPHIRPTLSLPFVVFPSYHHGRIVFFIASVHLPTSAQSLLALTTPSILLSLFRLTSHYTCTIFSLSLCTLLTSDTDPYHPPFKHHDSYTDQSTPTSGAVVHFKQLPTLPSRLPFCSPNIPPSLFVMSTSTEYHSYSPSSSSSLTIIASPAPSYVSTHLPSKLKSFFKFGGVKRYNTTNNDCSQPPTYPTAADNKTSVGVVFVVSYIFGVFFFNCTFAHRSRLKHWQDA